MLKNGNLKNVVKEKKLNFILHSDTQKKNATTVFCIESIVIPKKEPEGNVARCIGRGTLHCTRYVALYVYMQNIAMHFTVRVS